MVHETASHNKRTNDLSLLQIEPVLLHYVAFVETFIRRGKSFLVQDERKEELATKMIQIETGRSIFRQFVFYISDYDRRRTQNKVV